MADPFIGEIKLVPYNFAPTGWALCHGQLISIAQNTALFSLLGTMYGGNGQTTFALPDLRGRVPIHTGQGPGLSPYTQGEAGGEPTHTVTMAEMPVHSHTVGVSSAVGASAIPIGSYPAVATAATGNSYGAVANGSMHAESIRAFGQNVPHNNLQPYLGLNYVIALQGVFPPRN